MIVQTVVQPVQAVAVVSTRKCASVAAAPKVITRPINEENLNKNIPNCLECANKILQNLIVFQIGLFIKAE